MAAVAEPTATRQAYGKALVELGAEHSDVVALDADLSVSTQAAKFGKEYPDRFFNVGAAEANMMSMACGLAATGKVPYCSTFAIFASGRAYDQVRLGIAHNELKVRIGASHGGVSLGEDGASHQMIEDIALMRAMPRMQVIVPADYNQAYRAVLHSYEHDEPMYLRFGRPATPVVYDDVPEQLNSVDVLREGRDITLIATGHMVWRALEAPSRSRRRTASRRRSSTSRSSSRSTPKSSSSLWPRPVSRSPPRNIARSAASPTPCARSPPSSTPSRSLRSAWATSSASRERARPAWSTSG